MAKIKSSPDEVAQPEMPDEVADAVAAVEAAPVDLDRLLVQKAIDEAGEVQAAPEAPPRVTFTRMGPNGTTEVLDSTTGEVVDRWFNDEKP